MHKKCHPPKQKSSNSSQNLFGQKINVQEELKMFFGKKRSHSETTGYESKEKKRRISPSSDDDSLVLSKEQQLVSYNSSQIHENA